VPGIVVIAGSGPHSDVTALRESGGFAEAAPARLIAGPGFAGAF
jgi:hypothetical protein